MAIRIVTKIELVALLLQEISSKSIHNFFSYPMDRQTDRSEKQPLVEAIKLKHFIHLTDTLKFTVKNRLWKGRQEQIRF